MQGSTSGRVRLNIGGWKYETTRSTLTGDGKIQTFFSSAVRHCSPDEEIFIDRDGECFAPLLSYLRTGVLRIPPVLSDAAVRAEADYFCIPLPPAQPSRSGPLRFDGMYLSFGARPSAAAHHTDSSGLSSVAQGEVRAYLQFSSDQDADPSSGCAILGRREADGQWSALRCRYTCLAGGLLLVRPTRQPASAEPPREAEVEDAAAVTEQEEVEPEQDVELSAVVLHAEFIEVITCGRVGRIENPFHFIRSTPPRAGSAFVSQAAKPASGHHAPGRVVLGFESGSAVGVMVTSSHPGWSSASAATYSAACGRRPDAADEAPPPTPAAGSEPAAALLADSLWHLTIDHGNFTRTVDFVSLGDHGLIEFVQLNAQHEPQLIWYRPVANAPNPWSLPAP